MGIEQTFLLLFVIASAVTVLAQRLGIPYTIALLLAGLALGAAQLVQAPLLTRDMLFMFFLPGLIFEAAYRLPFDELWRDRGAILGLAIPGVVLTIAVTALLLVSASAGIAALPAIRYPELGWPLALMFGAAVAASDPIAVIALFRRLGAPRRLTLLIEGESLFNDGTAIVFFSLAMSVLLGGHVAPGQLVTQFFVVTGGGILIGGLLGMLFVQVIRYVDDAMIAITLTTALAYGAFLLADQLGFSGVISTLSAGLVAGNQARGQTMAPSLQVTTNTFWEYLGFLLNSLVFLLMGFEIRLQALWQVWPLILLAWAAMTLARAVVVGLTYTMLNWSRARIPPVWAGILSWGGLRGALSMVLAMSLPPDVPERETIVNLVFGVVFLSIVLQGLSITPLARRLGLLGTSETLARWETNRARLQFAADVLVELSHMRETGLFDEQVLNAVEAEYRSRMAQANTALEQVELDPALRYREEHLQLRRRMLLFEKNRAQTLRRQGIIGMDAYRDLISDIDTRLLALEAGEETPLPEPPESARGEVPDSGKGSPSGES